MAGILPNSLGAEDESPSNAWRSAAWQRHLADAVVDGRRMHYVDVGQGPPVILVHGLASAWSAWFRNISALAHDHRVIAVDLPGFGRSDRLSGRVEIRHYVDALRALLDQLGIGRAGIVGHSLGGIIALEFAARHPERSAALVVVASGGPPGRLQETFLRGLGVGSALLNRAPRRVFASAVGGAMAVAPLRQLLIGQAVHDPSAVSRGLAAHMITTACCSSGTPAALWAALREIRRREPRPIACPTLVVGGRRDRLVSATSLDSLTAAITGARCEMIPGAGHHPMFECPEVFNELMRNFLADSWVA